MRNFWWWVIGGGALLWVVNKSKAETPTRVEGNLEVAITWKNGKNTLAAATAAFKGLSAMVGCGGPALLGASGQYRTAGAVTGMAYNAVWSHNIVGPIKESVRVCMLKSLQALDSNILDFQATRTS